jgi:uncharacterized protein
MLACLACGAAPCVLGDELKTDAKFLEQTVTQAKAGDPVAQCALGACFESGQGVAKDLEQAVKWYRMAADQGDAMAQCALGNCYEKGQGVARSATNAVAWYAKSAAKGFARGQYLLGACYAEGRGVARDYLEAYKWYTRAAAKGYEPAKKGVLAVHGRMTAAQRAEAKRLEAAVPAPAPSR